MVYTEMSLMKKCPVCNSETFYGSKELGYRCRRCGYTNIPEPVRRSLNHHKRQNDRGIIESRKPSLTIMNSSLFSEMHDLHNIAYRFRIIGDLPAVDLPRQKGFKGRIYRFSYKGRKIMLSSKWLVIYNSKRVKIPLKDLDQADQQIRAELAELALELASSYGIKLDPEPRLFSKNRPEIKTPFLSGSNFIEPEAKAVYPLPSPIELTGSNAKQNAFNLSESLIRLNDSIQLEIKNKQLHQATLNDMRDALADLRSYFSEAQASKNVSNIITKRISFWLSDLKEKTMTFFKNKKDGESEKNEHFRQNL